MLKWSIQILYKWLFSVGGNFANFYSNVRVGVNYVKKNSVIFTFVEVKKKSYLSLFCPSLLLHNLWSTFQYVKTWYH